MGRMKIKPVVRPRPSSAESIFLQAASFHHAQEILMKSSVPAEEREALVLPVCVLAAFTSELMLKCIICIEGDSPPRSHDLLVLFDKLSAKTRKRLEWMWTDHVQFHRDHAAAFKQATGVAFEPDLKLALAAGKKAFELIRYWHEGPKEEFAFYLGALPDMLGKIAFELRPDWAEYAQKMWQERGGA